MRYVIPIPNISTAACVVGTNKRKKNMPKNLSVMNCGTVQANDFVSEFHKLQTLRTNKIITGADEVLKSQKLNFVFVSTSIHVSTFGCSTANIMTSRITSTEKNSMSHLNKKELGIDTWPMFLLPKILKIRLQLPMNIAFCFAPRKMNLQIDNLPSFEE
jgi:hypothetical protein